MQNLNQNNIDFQEITPKLEEIYRAMKIEDENIDLYTNEERDKFLNNLYGMENGNVKRTTLEEEKKEIVLMMEKNTKEIKELEISLNQLIDRLKISDGDVEIIQPPLDIETLSVNQIYLQEEKYALDLQNTLLKNKIESTKGKNTEVIINQVKEELKEIISHLKEISDNLSELDFESMDITQIEMARDLLEKILFIYQKYKQKELIPKEKKECQIKMKGQMDEEDQIDEEKNNKKIDKKEYIKKISNTFKFQNICAPGILNNLIDLYKLVISSVDMDSFVYKAKEERIQELLINYIKNFETILSSEYDFYITNEMETHNILSLFKILYIFGKNKFNLIENKTWDIDEYVNKMISVTEDEKNCLADALNEYIEEDFENNIGGMISKITNDIMVLIGEFPDLNINEKISEDKLIEFKAKQNERIDAIKLLFETIGIEIDIESIIDTSTKEIALSNNDKLIDVGIIQYKKSIYDTINMYILEKMEEMGMLKNITYNIGDNKLIINTGNALYIKNTKINKYSELIKYDEEQDVEILKFLNTILNDKNYMKNMDDIDSILKEIKESNKEIEILKKYCPELYESELEILKKKIQEIKKKENIHTLEKDVFSAIKVNSCKNVVDVFNKKYLYLEKLEYNKDTESLKENKNLKLKENKNPKDGNLEKINSKIKNLENKIIVMKKRAEKLLKIAKKHKIENSIKENFIEKLSSQEYEGNIQVDIIQFHLKLKLLKNILDICKIDNVKSEGFLCMLPLNLLQSLNLLDTRKFKLIVESANVNNKSFQKGLENILKNIDNISIYDIRFLLQINDSNRFYIISNINFVSKLNFKYRNFEQRDIEYINEKYINNITSKAATAIYNSNSDFFKVICDNIDEFDKGTFNLRIFLSEPAVTLFKKNPEMFKKNLKDNIDELHKEINRSDYYIQKSVDLACGMVCSGCAFLCSNLTLVCIAIPCFISYTMMVPLSINNQTTLASNTTLTLGLNGNGLSPI